MLRTTRSGSAPARVRAVVLATALSAGLGMSAVSATAATAQTLSPGQTASSKNMELLANVPKQGAFAPESAFNSDLAFKGDYAFAGNYNGFMVYDIKQPRKPVPVTQVVCPGAQNDISVLGDLLVLSVDSRRTNSTCTNEPATAAQSASGAYWEGIRIFNIADPTAPRFVGAVETDCGSHTHTLVPAADGKVFVYVSSYGPFTVNTGTSTAPNVQPIKRCQAPHDAISIVQVDTTPEAAEMKAAQDGVKKMTLFPDGGLTTRTEGCHDITAYPSKGIAAGACMGEGVIMDIRNPATPVLLDRVKDTENFAFWHSATFNNAASTVMFTDELGGGGAPTCNPTVGPNKGANAYYTLSSAGKLAFQDYFKIPREQANTENCVAHNGSLIPVHGKDVMVQAWYQGGISVVDFTDPKNPTELGFFDRGPLSTERLILGGSWSAYYYKGYIYSNDIQKGLDVLEFRSPSVANGKSGKFPTDYNPQTQVELSNKPA